MPTGAVVGSTTYQPTNYSLKQFADDLWRHTAGRVDSLFKAAGMLWVATLQTTKILLKSLVVVLTFDQLKHIINEEEGSEQPGISFWSSKGLMTDIGRLGVFLYTASTGARGVLCAPKERYTPSYRPFVFGLADVFGGEYHHETHGIMNQLKLAYKLDPFFGKESPVESSPEYVSSPQSSTSTASKPILDSGSTRQPLLFTMPSAKKEEPPQLKEEYKAFSTISPLNTQVEDGDVIDENMQVEDGDGAESSDAGSDIPTNANSDSESSSYGETAGSGS